MKGKMLNEWNINGGINQQRFGEDLKNIIYDQCVQRVKARTNDCEWINGNAWMNQWNQYNVSMHEWKK